MVQLISCRVISSSAGRYACRHGAICPPHLVRIFIGEQRRIAAGNRQPRRAALERRAHSVVQPLGRAFEALVGAKW